MQNRIVLISDDSDFFEYISSKLKLRKSDELYRYSFDELPEKIQLINSSLLIINSENSEDKTLELLEIAKGTPSIVFSFNDNENFRIKAYRNGALDFITLSTSDEELEAKLVPALNIVSSFEKNNLYREMLVKNNLVTQNNEVFLDYNNMLDREIEKIKTGSISAVLAAISPNDKTKFLLKANQIETTILNNIRKNDILMNFAPNKYFLLLYNTDIESAEKIWEKIVYYIPEKIYAGFAAVGNKNRQQLVNEVLNKLHESMHKNSKTDIGSSNTYIENYKLYKQEFNKKFEMIISPVFYQIQQMYNNKLFGMNIQQEIGEGYGNLYINSKYSEGRFRITSPGQSKINIDITFQSIKLENKKASPYPQTKRITLEPDEFEAGLLEDLLEQFIIEFKSEVNIGNT